MLRNWNWERVKDLVLDNLYDLFGALMFGIGFYNFAEGGSFAPGGVTGSALLLREFIPGVPRGIMSFCVNIPIILL